MSSKFKFFILIVLVAFVSLPLVFQEQTPLQLLQKENTFYERETSLPVFSKDNLVKKYVKRLKKFYNLDTDSKYQNNTPEENVIIIAKKAKKAKNNPNNSARNSYNQDTVIDGSDFLFAEEQADEENSSIDSFAYENDKYVNIENGTVLTKDNLLLKPKAEGYYYNNTFFKNGTYPKFANRRYIEGALNRYHTKVANMQGKRAFYSSDEKGNLTVNYVDKLPYNRYNLKNSQYKPQENTYIAANKFKDAYNKYRGAKIGKKTSNSAMTDIIDASLYDMHSAYDLLREQIKNMSFTIDLSEALSQDINNVSEDNNMKEFFEDKESQNITIADKPNKPTNPPAAASDTLTVVVGDENFSKQYAFDVHDVGCSTGYMFTKGEVKKYHIDKQIEDNPQISIKLGECKKPLEITPSSQIAYNIPHTRELSSLRENIKNIAKQNEQTTIKIVSTDRTVAPMVMALDEEQTITNKKGEFIKITTVGPKSDESNLANVLGDITNTVIEEQDKAKELNNILNESYLTSELRPTNTILAYQAGDNEVFVVNDPSNSYWLKNPKEVNIYKQQYFIKDGVYYKGAIIPTQDIMEMARKDKTNFLLVSDIPSEHIMPNGSVFITVKEDDVNMHSFNSETIIKNIEMAQLISKKGDFVNMHLPSVYNIFKDRKNKNQEPPQRFDPEGKTTFNVSINPNNNNNQEKKANL